jgi:hypothetical protein
VKRGYRDNSAVVNADHQKERLNAWMKRGREVIFAPDEAGGAFFRDEVSLRGQSKSLLPPLLGAHAVSMFSRTAVHSVMLA